MTSPADFSSETEVSQPLPLQEFSEKLNLLPTPEEKIAHGLLFMRNAISQEGSPHFREFWEVRRLVLPFFRENLNSAIRSKLWGEYVELTVEARRLKEILEEQSSFAMEQIDLAIGSIETDLAQLETLLAQAGDIAFTDIPQTLEQKIGVYNKIQRELNLLNTLASRLAGLRKEIIKTDMRIRFKTKFFKRLSELGDRIFPKRKELMDAVGNEFEKDIDLFVSRHFQGEEAVGAPYYALRGEIKALQGMAKFLTLSSGVFNRTRLKLSECWDKIKVLEKEHKKEVTQKKQASSEQRLLIDAKIDELKTRSEAMSLQELDKELEEISRSMREVSLHRDDVFALRDALAALRAPHLDKQEKRAREQEEAEKEKHRLRRERVVALKERIGQVSKAGMELEPLNEAYLAIVTELDALEISKLEKQQIERQLRSIKDAIAEKKEQNLFNLSDDDKQMLENLRTVLQQKKERRQEIKDQLESYRKTLGGSGLDFERAMQLQELASQEKERLEKANLGIQEIEKKIAEMT